MITSGFGLHFDIKTGKMRSWYMRKDGVPRWIDNDQPIEKEEAKQDEGSSTSSNSKD